MCVQEVERQALVTVATTEGYSPTAVGSIIDDLRRYAIDNARGLPAQQADALGGSGASAVHQHTPGGTHQHTPGGLIAAGGAYNDVDFDKPVVQTKSAVEYQHTYFEIAMRRRAQEAAQAAGATGRAIDEAGSTQADEAVVGGGRVFGSVAVSASGSTALIDAAEVGLSSSWYTREFEDVLPLPHPSPRECNVHSCVLLADDIACQRNGSCSLPLGHLEGMGSQFAAPIPVEEMADAAYAASDDGGARPPPADPRRFWKRFVGGYRPVVVRGGASSLIDEPWDDAFLKRHCRLDGGMAWRALIERNNRVVQNDRHPLMYDWTFCTFIHNYTRPDYKNMLYVVTPLTERGVALPRHLRVPDVLRCAELHGTIYEARLWMSGGNTTSSLHFDTHDNLMLQLDGSKEVYLWHPRESAKFYSDFHNKFGLSPISADRVDLDRFPEFAAAATHRALMRKGDSLYIPDGWWHLIRSHGRNVAVAVEFEPFERNGESHWPDEVLGRYRWPGLFWAEQVRIKYEMRQRLGPRQYTSPITRVPIRCESLEEHPMLFSALAQQMERLSSSH